MAEIKEPQDRKPKTEAFTFTGIDGKDHTLPLASKGAEKMSGGDFMDAAMGGEIGQIKYLFQVLTAAGPSEKALEALRSLSQNAMIEVLEAWGNFGDGDGASLGK